MKVVYKYTLGYGFNSEAMPEGATFLSAQAQYEQITLWMLTEPGARMVERRFHVVGTGHKFDETGHMYQGTVMTDGGRFVWHVFEVVPCPV